jgi:hypothetical protein
MELEIESLTVVLAAEPLENVFNIKLTILL